MFVQLRTLYTVHNTVWPVSKPVKVTYTEKVDCKSQSGVARSGAASWKGRAKMADLERHRKKSRRLQAAKGMLQRRPSHVW